MPGHVWQPIADIPANWREELMDNSIHAALTAWKSRAGQLRERRAFQQFTERLHREWAIETGIIEGAYRLSDGATLTLIQQGLDAALISHDDTGNEDPTDVVRKINDQYQAIMGLYQFVSSQRDLGTSYIRELHHVLMEHQRQYRARDQFNNEVIRELHLGEWKRWPNHVDLPDGSVFEYCPPEHVSHEMDNLISMHRRHVADGVPVDIEAAWLHHRFTLIHPFEDGNGRVARCLATLVLLRAEWLPFVVSRREKPAYIAAIRAADTGQLRPLVDFIGERQRFALREAISLAEDAMDMRATRDEQLSAIEERLRSRAHQDQQTRANAVQLADILCKLAHSRLEETQHELQELFNLNAPELSAKATWGPRGSNQAGYNRYQIAQCAKEWKYFADFDAYQSWSMLEIRGTTRFQILIAFHGIGRGHIGYLGASAMIYRKVQDEVVKSRIEDLRPLGSAPFEFAYSEASAEVSGRFEKWLEQRIREALAIWQSGL